MSIHGILRSIKRDRKLSFNNWRYKLLHWTFGINPATPQESFLPHFLYSHFCPLFHLTNFLVLLIPFILIFKIVWGTLKLMGACAGAVFDFFDRIKKRAAETRKQIATENAKLEEARKEKEAEVRKKERAKIMEERGTIATFTFAKRQELGTDDVRTVVSRALYKREDKDSEPSIYWFARYYDDREGYLRKFRDDNYSAYSEIKHFGDDVIGPVIEEYVTRYTEQERVKQMQTLPVAMIGAFQKNIVNAEDFERFYDTLDLWAVKKDAVRPVWEETAERYRVAVAEREERQRLMRERMVFWINFSQGLFKVGTWLVMGVGALLAAYVLFIWVLPAIWIALCWTASTCWEVGHWFTTVDWQAVGQFVFYTAIGVVAGGTLLWGLIKFFTTDTACKVWNATLGPPVNATGSTLGYIFKGIGNQIAKNCRGVIEFFMMFYEDNCPAIEIVTDAEAELDEIAQGE